MAETKDTVVIDFQINEGEAVVSIQNLTKANKELREERNKLDLATKDGITRAKEINSMIDRNTNAIKANSSALEKQRLNVGNYTESIKKASGAFDKFIPGLGAATQGIGGVTTAAKAFIATPFGAIIGAIGVALGSLIAYFKGSEEGQNKLNKILQIGGAIMEKITDVVEMFGGALFDVLGKAITFVADGLDKLATAVGINTEGIKEFFSAVDEDAEKFFQAEKKRAELLRELTVERAKTAKEVAELIVRAQEAEGAARLKLVNEAIALKKQLLDKELEFAQNGFDQAKMQADRDPTIENLQKRAEAEAELFNQQASYSEGIKKLNAQRISAETDLNKQASEERMAQDDVERDHFISNLEIKQLAVDDHLARMNKSFSDAQKKNTVVVKKENKTQEQLDFLTGQNKLANASFVIGQVAGLLGKETAAYKVLAISQAYIDTYRAATAALAPPPVGAGPLFGPILAGATIIAGLTNIAKIGAAAGGGSFMTKGPQLLLVGDNPGGVERVDVHPISGRGRTVVGKNMVAMAGGGTMYTDAGIAANGSQTSFGSHSMNLKMNFVYSEFKEFENSVTSKNALAEA